MPCGRMLGVLSTHRGERVKGQITHTSVCGAWLSLTLPAQGPVGPAHSEKTSVSPCVCILVSIDGIFF